MIDRLVRRTNAGRLARIFAAVLGLGLAAMFRADAEPVSVLTYHNDNLRTGWNPNEVQLTTANVNAAHFGLKFSVPLDGVVFAQPLYVPQVTIGGVGRNLVVVATENATVYGIDADTGATLWTHPFAKPPGIVASRGCRCVGTEVQAITGTPTIDVSRNSIYVVARTDETVNGHSVTYYRLHALLLASGKDRVNPVEIELAAPASSGGTLRLSPIWNLQRPGLAEFQGVIYVGFGSQGDHQPATTTGWLAAFDAVTLKAVGALPTGATMAGGSAQYQHVVTGGFGPVRLASIWMSGSAPAIDRVGNLYVQTGNGAFDGHLDWGQSLLKIPPTLSGVVDSFTPATYRFDNDHDGDLGSAGVVLLPQAAGTYNVAVGGGKRGITYLLNEEHLGGVQRAGDPTVLFSAATNFGLWGTPATYIGADGNTYVIIPGSGPMTSWRVSTGTKPGLDAAGHTPDSFGKGADGGTIPVISSNGRTPGTAIVWAYSRAKAPTEIMLRAYDAADLGHELLDIPFAPWQLQADSLLTPLVANGKVYAAGPSVLRAYGLR